MSQQSARTLVIKRYNGSTYDFVCGIRTRSWGGSNAQIDTTVPDCEDPSAPISATAMPGRQTLTFSGDGLFDSADIGKDVADDFRLQRVTEYQVIVPGYGTFHGPMMIGDFEWSGEMEEQMAFSATWVPTAPPDFTAEA